MNELYILARLKLTTCIMNRKVDDDVKYKDLKVKRKKNNKRENNYHVKRNNN